MKISLQIFSCLILSFLLISPAITEDSKCKKPSLVKVPASKSYGRENRAPRTRANIMKRSINILSNILIILSGPLVTAYMVIAGKGFKIKGDMFLYVGIATAIALIVSIAVHFLCKQDSKKSIITSVVVSELIYALLAIIDAMNNPKSMMWLPIALLFLPLFTLPTAISVSFGIGKIFEINRIKRCVNCGAEINTNDNFCVKCGKQIAFTDKDVTATVTGWKCPECGTINRDDIVLCSCGYDSNR